MEAKGARGTIFELRDFLNEWIEENENMKIKHFQMFPIDSKIESEMNEPYYEIMVIFE